MKRFSLLLLGLALLTTTTGCFCWWPFCGTGYGYGYGAHGGYGQMHYGGAMPSGGGCVGGNCWTAPGGGMPMFPQGASLGGADVLHAGVPMSDPVMTAAQPFSYPGAMPAGPMTASTAPVYSAPMTAGLADAAASRLPYSTTPVYSAPMTASPGAPMTLPFGAPGTASHPHMPGTPLPGFPSSPVYPQTAMPPMDNLATY